MVEPHRQEHQGAQDPGKSLLAEIQRRLPRRVAPDQAVRAVMCTFTLHVSGGEVRDIFMALPASLEPLLERCMLHRSEAAETFGRDQLIVRVAEHLGISLEEAERTTWAVLKVIRSQLPKKDVKAVANQLPLELRALWLDELAVEPHPLFLEIEESAVLPRGVSGQRAFMYVLCTFTRRLSKGEARQVADGLPHEVRPLLESCLTARAEQPEHFTKWELLEHIGKDLHTSRPEPLVRAVLAVVKRYLRSDTIAHVRAQLPGDLKELWQQPVADRDSV